MVTEYDPNVTDLSAIWTMGAIMLVYLGQLGTLIQEHSQSLLVAGMIITIIVLMDWLANAKRRQAQAVKQAEMFVDILRRTHPLVNGENNMVKDIGRVVTSRMFSYAEVKRIMARLIKAQLDELVADKRLTNEQRDIISEQLALQMNCWELYPKKPKGEPPNPADVKRAILARIEGFDKVIPVEIPGAKPAPPKRGFDRFRKRA